MINILINVFEYSINAFGLYKCFIPAFSRFLIKYSYFGFRSAELRLAVRLAELPFYEQLRVIKTD